MPRLPDRVVSRMQPTSAQGARLGPTELSSTTVTEARAVAKQAIDAVANSEALAALATQLQGEPLPSPLSSLADSPSGKRWLDGTARLGASSSTDDLKLLQRALMKIGAHHAQGREQPSLMLLPWGADGSLGQGTLKAVDVALKLAGRADLTPVANRQPMGREVAQAIESLLRSTPSIALPPQRDVFPTSPVTPAAPAPSSTPQRLNLMDRVALPVATTNYDARWKGVLGRVAAEQSKYRVGSPTLSVAANAWLRELESVRGQPQWNQLNRVNSFINDFAYQSDVHDTWSTPLEFFDRRGDCEDYAIAKMVSLERLGFEPSRMRLLVVNDTLSRQTHAVLAVDMPDATYILDNQSQLVLKHDEIKVSGQHIYTPLAALDRQKQWTYGVQR